MIITQDMIQRAVKKSVELELLPRKSQIEDIATNCELMFEVLQAALGETGETVQHADIQWNPDCHDVSTI